MVQTKEFTELLKGCRPVKDSDGNIVVQSILNMQLVCLTTDDEYSLDDRFSNPLQSLTTSNRSYGHMAFRNTSQKDTIVPAQAVALTKQRAQNHAMIKSAYLSKGSTRDFNDAGCVQGSQTGHFSGVGGDELRVIPVTIREMLFDLIDSNSTGGHSHIYPAIRKLGQQTNSNTGDYIDKYFNKYDKKLEQFIAHFERPDKLIGIIVLIDGEIVAIDKFPSFTYAEQVWDIMIRDCYGALAIISELKKSKARPSFTENFSKLRGRDGESTLEKLERALKNTKSEITNSVNEKLQNLLDLTLEAKQETKDTGGRLSASSPKSYKLEHEGYVGQLISEQDYHHLVSIVKRESFDPKALQAVTEMKRKARSQDRFTL